jgi:hypothetical protein
MIDWLYSLPEYLLLASSALTLVILVLVLPSLVSRIPWMKPNDANTDFVLRLQGTLFTMTTLVVAFTLVEAESNFRKVDSLISSEASQLDRLDRLLNRYGDPAALAIRPHVLAYATSIVRDEWPSMLQDGEPSGRTRAAFGAIAAGSCRSIPSRAGKR